MPNHFFSSSKELNSFCGADDEKTKGEAGDDNKDLERLIGNGERLKKVKKIELQMARAKTMKISDKLPLTALPTDANGTRCQLDFIARTGNDYYYRSSDGSFIVASFNYCSTCVNPRIEPVAVTMTDETVICYGSPNSQNRQFPTKIRDNQGNYLSIAYIQDDQVGKIAYIRILCAATSGFITTPPPIRS